MSPSSFDWRSFPDYLSGPLSPDPSPLNHSSSLPHSSGSIAMSIPVQTTYPYSFQDSHLPAQSQLPVNVNNSFSYPSPDLDLQHILDIPIGNHLLHDSSDATQPAILSHAERNHDAILSPVSVNDFMTPCHSPVDVRSPLDYPTPASLHSPLKGPVVHTILPSSFPENHVINFDVSVSFPHLIPPTPLTFFLSLPVVELYCPACHELDARLPKTFKGPPASGNGSVCSSFPPITDRPREMGYLLCSSLRASSRRSKSPLPWKKIFW